MELILKMNGQLLENFSKLSNGKDAQRLDASLKILKAVNNKNQGDVDYVLTRIVRGLGSSRDVARQGFYVTLTQLISQVSQYLTNYLSI